MNSRLKFGLAALASAWALFAFFHLHHYAVPWMDTWCYFAPAVAGRPLQLVEPFLGAFGGADHTWGLQWPGSLLLANLVFAVVPHGTGAFVAWQIALWLACATALAAVVRRVSGSDLLGAFAFLFVLADRAFFFVAYAQRLEFLAVLMLVPLVFVLHARSIRPDAAPERLALLAAFASPLIHVAAIPLAAMLLLLSLHRSWSSGASLRWPLWQLLAWFLGCAAAAAWLLLDPETRSQFTDHLQSAVAVYAARSILLSALQLFYLPTYTGHLIYLSGLVAAVLLAFRSRGGLRGAHGAETFTFDLSLACVGALVSLHAFHNPNYLIVCLPVLLPVLALGLRRLLEGRPAWVGRGTALAGLALVVLHGAFWVTRSLKMREGHFPNLRAELNALWRELPPARRIYIPESLWEAALLSPKPQGTQVRMSTLPNAATPPRRAAYEAEVYAGEAAGDLLIVDAFQSFPRARALVESDWQELRRVERKMPGNSAWGYDLRILQRR